MESIEHLREAAEIAGVSTDVVPPEDRFLVLDGLRFHYLNWPGADFPVVLFLHGGGLTAHTWDMVCLELRTGYRCLALDQRGHGDTDWSESLAYSRHDHCRDIAALVDALWLGNVVLVGQSMGAINAITFAARHPTFVQALVVVDAGPDVVVSGAQRIRDFVRSDGELPSIEHFVERAVAFNPRRNPALLRRSLMHNLRRLDNGNWTWKYDRRRFADTNFADDLSSLWDDVAKIDRPVLVVRGAESDLFTDDQAARLADAFPHGRWTRIDGAGHNVQGDNPRDFSAAIKSFLADST